MQIRREGTKIEILAIYNQDKVLPDEYFHSVLENEDLNKLKRGVSEFSIDLGN